MRFREASEELGIEFLHHHGGSGEFYMVETMGSGVALLDYDGDGDLDILLVDSGALRGYQGEPGRTVLYRNDGDSFFDATEMAGLVVESYGMGVTAGDIDSDGDLDIYITAFGPNHLFENRGDGRFGEVGRKAGVDDSSWGASAAFADSDGDGDLDLYVTNYVDFSYEKNPVCGEKDRGLRSYCHPDSFFGLPDRFYRNQGDGSFEDATAEAGFAEASGAGLGVLFTDLDGDSLPDIYVANDMTPNFLFRNLGNGSFEETALLAGVSLGQRGEPEAGMGVAAGDLDGDGLPEIFVTHLDLQTNALYSAMGKGLFLDRRFAARVAEPSVYRVGFGATFDDFDLDGDLDILVANGHIIHNVEAFGRGGSYKQPNQVLENLGDGKFAEAEGIGLDVVRSSRGLATGDLDGDGDVDAVISNSNDHVEVYLNESGRDGSWLSTVPVPGMTAPPVGARFELLRSSGGQTRQLATGSSYLSQSGMEAYFGLPEAASNDLRIRWPGGAEQMLRALPPGRRIAVTPPKAERAD